MPLADVNFGELLLLVFEIFIFMMWFWILFVIITDLFRDHEVSGWWKAVWVLFLVFVPFITGLIYLIARGQGMAKRAAAARQQELDTLRAELGTSGSPADELHKLADLKDRGAISDEEYQRLKSKVTS